MLISSALSVLAVLPLKQANNAICNILHIYYLFPVVADIASCLVYIRKCGKEPKQKGKTLAQFVCL